MGTNKDLFIIIKKKYLDEIKSGIKKYEYRLVTPYWAKRLVDVKYRNIIFQAGYSKDSERLILPYKGYCIMNVKHDFFGNEPVTVFAINLYQ